MSGDDDVPTVERDLKRSVPHVLLGLAAAMVGCDADSNATPPSGSAQPSVSASTAADAAPKIAAVEPVFAFGRVKVGTKVEHDFKVKNVGTAPLKITRAKGS